MMYNEATEWKRNYSCDDCWNGSGEDVRKGRKAKGS